MQQHLTMSGSNTFLIRTFPQVGNLPLWSLRIHVRVKQAQRTYCASTGTGARPVFPCAHTVQGSTMEPERGDRKSERLRKRKAVTPHRPIKRPRLFQVDQQETELRHRLTLRKWRHNLAVYYAANSHGSCVNSAKSA